MSHKKDLNPPLACYMRFLIISTLSHQKGKKLLLKAKECWVRILLNIWTRSGLSPCIIVFGEFCVQNRPVTHNSRTFEIEGGWGGWH